MVQGEDGRWRSMANEKLYESKMLIGAIYRSELARGLGRLGYGIEKTHADGRFEIAGVSREIIDAFSTRRAEIEAGMAERGFGHPSDNPRLAERAALVSRAAKRDIDRGELAGLWQRQGADLGFDAASLAAEAAAKGAEPPGVEREAGHGRDGAARANGVEPRDGGSDAAPALQSPADEAVAWAVAHLSEREAVFSRTDLLAAALAWNPGEVTVGEAEAAAGRLEKAGSLHAARLPGMDGLLTTDKTVGNEKETIALMAAGPGPRGDTDARPRRGQGAAGRSADRGPEGRRQVDRRLARPRGRRPGLCRQRQDHHAEPRPGAAGEARLRGARPRALGVRRAHAGGRGRDRERDAAALPRAPRGRRRRADGRRRGTLIRSRVRHRCTITPRGEKP